jgi:Tfp pilus assembly protein PilF
MHDIPENPRALMSMIAALCSDIGLHERALGILERIAVETDHGAHALVALALGQWRAGDEAGAGQTLRRALAADPEHDMARVMLAVYLHQSRDPQAPVLLRAVLARKHSAAGGDPDALDLAERVQADILQTTAPAERATRLKYTRVDLDSTSRQ